MESHGINRCINLACWKYYQSVFRITQAQVNSNSQVGLSYQQKVGENVSLTLSTMVEAKTFNQGGHKIGLGLEFE